MTARLAALPRNAQLALVGVLLLVITLAGYLALISPKRAEAGDLQRETAAVRMQIDHNRSTAFTQALPAVRSASVFKLAKAMPSDVSMANIILELNQLALDSGITFDEITPQAPVADTAFDAEPIKVQFSGNFYNLSDFLLRLRNLVRVEDGKLLARGRMYAISDIGFTEGEDKFPNVKAALTVNAFVPTAPQSAAATTTSTSTTGTTTTPSASAAPQPNGGTS